MAVIGYPRWFIPSGAGLEVPVLGCQGVRRSDQVWINERMRMVNDAIRTAATSMGAEYVDIYDVSVGHELCSGNEPFMNGTTLPPEAYHPNQLGYRLITDRLADALSAASPGVAYTILPERTVTTSYAVAEDSPTLSATTSWPGSDVVMTLISPSGRILDRATSADDVHHANGPTFERYLVVGQPFVRPAFVGGRGLGIFCGQTPWKNRGTHAGRTSRR